MTAQQAPNKKQVIAQLKEAARLMEVAGEDPFKARAYLSAVRSLETFGGDFEGLFNEDRLSDIRGIGKGLAAEVRALKAQEMLPALEELRARVPEGVRELFVVSGLGPKRIATLWQGGISSLEELIDACDSGRLARHRGFSAKTAEALAAAARFALDARGRMRLDVAEVYANLLQFALKEALPGAQLVVAGSLRRGCETVDALELLVLKATPEELMKALGQLLQDAQPGEGQVSGRFQGSQVRLTVVPPEALAPALVLRTGSSPYTQALKQRAAAQGYELTERGIYREDAPLPLKDERELYELLKLPFIEPERREEADPSPLPNLLEARDLRGLIHNHSTYSDGVNSLREMVAGARERAYAYLGIADHSRASTVANGLSLERLLAQRQEVELIRKELQDEGAGFTLLHGLEVDILQDGSLDFPDEVLAELDYTVVSVHSHFGLSEKEQTRRIVRAVHNPHAKILGHATGRLLLRRPSYPLDLQAVIEACAQTGTVIEINANPRRLDLDWRWVIKAKELGCRFSINPDAHQVEGYDHLRYGVMMARKAGLTPEDVVNTASGAEGFLAGLKRA